MKTKTIIIKKGQETSRLSVLKELTDEIKECFEDKDAPKTGMFFTPQPVSVAKQSYKFTFTVEEIDAETKEDEAMLEAFCKRNEIQFRYTERELPEYIQNFLREYRK